MRRTLWSALVHQDTYALDHSKVCLLVASTDIVFFTRTSTRENEMQCTCMVIHIKPVAHVQSIAVKWQSPAVTRIEDDEGDELFGALAGAVVIGAVGDQRKVARTYGATLRPNDRKPVLLAE